jgi:dolichol-phosphate hexosyltransferase
MSDVVYGVRMFGMNTVYQSYRYAIGNRVTTLVANVLFDSCLSDLHSCLKLMPVDLFRSLNLTQSGFGLDSEVTAELLRRGYRPYEIPVSYVSRSHAQGKKLTWRDGVDCLAILSRVRARGLLDEAGRAPVPPTSKVVVSIREARAPDEVDDRTNVALFR